MNLPASRWLQCAFIISSNLLRGKIICRLDSNKNNSKARAYKEIIITVYRERTGRIAESKVGVQNKTTAGLPLQKGRGAFKKMEGKHCQSQGGKKEMYASFRVRKTESLSQRYVLAWLQYLPSSRISFSEGIKQPKCWEATLTQYQNYYRTPPLLLYPTFTYYLHLLKSYLIKYYLFRYEFHITDQCFMRTQFRQYIVQFGQHWVSSSNRYSNCTVFSIPDYLFC